MNPYRSLQGPGEDTLRWEVMTELSRDEVSLTDLAESVSGSRRSVTEVVKEWREAGWVTPGNALTESGAVRRRSVKVAVQRDYAEFLREELGFTHLDSTQCASDALEFDEGDFETITLDEGSGVKAAMLLDAAMGTLPEVDVTDIEDEGIEDAGIEYEDVVHDLPSHEESEPPEPSEVTGYPSLSEQHGKALSWLESRDVFTSSDCPFSDSVLGDLADEGFIAKQLDAGITQWRVHQHSLEQP